MSNGLYYCDATRVRLGSQSDYVITWVAATASSHPLRIVSTSDRIDEFGDLHFDIGVQYLPERGIPMVSVRYSHRAGNTGFDHFSCNEYGEQADPEAGEILDWLLQDAWTWDARLGRLVSYEQRRLSLSYPLGFFATSEKGAIPLGFHSLKNPRTFARREHEMGRGTDAARLLELAQECRLITIWQPAYGENPILLAENMQQELVALNERCRLAGVNVKKVETEAELPEW